jgi:hypothetical protein
MLQVGSKRIICISLCVAYNRFSVNNESAKIPFPVRFLRFNIPERRTLNLEPFLRIEDHFHGGTVNVSATDNHAHASAGL